MKNSIESNPNYDKSKPKYPSRHCSRLCRPWVRIVKLAIAEFIEDNLENGKHLFSIDSFNVIYDLAVRYFEGTFHYDICRCLWESKCSKKRKKSSKNSKTKRFIERAKDSGNLPEEYSGKCNANSKQSIFPKDWKICARFKIYKRDDEQSSASSSSFFEV